MACLAQSLLDCEDFPGQTSHWRGVALSGQTWSGLTLERGGTPYLPPPPRHRAASVTPGKRSSLSLRW